jgi:hypothetical protein
MRRAAIFVVVVVAVAGSVRNFAPWFGEADIAAASHRLFVRDIDHKAIFASASTCHSFAQSFQWWTHTWIGLCGYWRPVTSQLFWSEYAIFGPDRYDLWAIISIVSNLLVLAALAQFAWLLTRSRPAVLFTVLAASATGALDVALFNWKDQPDLWVTLAVVLSMNATLRHRWGLAVAFAALAMCIKELGWIALPFDLALVATTGGLRAMPRWIYGAVVGVACAVAGLMGVSGFFSVPHETIGHNTNWLWRYVYSLDFPPAGAAATGVYELLPFVALFAWPRWWTFVAAFAVSVVIACLRLHIDAATAIFVMSNSGSVIGTTVAYALSFTLLARSRYRKLAAVLVVYVLAASANIVAGVSTQEHVLYLAHAIRAVVQGMASALAVEWVMRWVAARRVGALTAVDMA